MLIAWLRDEIRSDFCRERHSRIVSKVTMTTADPEVMDMLKKVHATVAAIVEETVAASVVATAVALITTHHECGVVIRSVASVCVSVCSDSDF